MRGIINRTLKYGTLLSTYALVGSVLLQIFARFFLENTPAWTEEASRLFFIYAISFAAGLALKDNYYVSLELFYEKLPPLVQYFLDVTIPILVLLLFIIISFFSIQLIQLGQVETSPSMGLKMSIAFFSMLIMAASISYYAWFEVKKAIKNKQT